MAESKQTVKAVVNIDVYRWYPDGTADGGVREAYRGDEITVSQDEFDRAQQMLPAGLVKPGSDEAKAAAAGDTPAPPPVAGTVDLPDDVSELSTAELKALAESRGLFVPKGMTRDELLAAVTDAPSGPLSTPET